MFSNRSAEEIGAELVLLLRRKAKLWEEHQRVAKRLDDLHSEALALDPLHSSLPAWSRAAKEANRPNREQTFVLNPIADTLTNLQIAEARADTEIIPAVTRVSVAGNSNG